MLDKQRWQELLKKAKEGEAIAQFEVGSLYSDGYTDSKQEIIIKQNNRLACKWYEKAAEQGYTNGLVSFAYHLDCGIGCDRDIEKAIKLYKMAITKGSGMAAFNLGTIYRDKGNYKKAFEYYSLSMSIDKSDYSLTVGLCYYYGIGIRQDKSIAAWHFRKVSVDKLNNHTQSDRDLGHYYLGLLYLTGEGLNKSLKLAKKHFEIANTENDNDSALALRHLIG